jgi:DNA invertase Pin-like site-specific DNA recombinase
MTPKARELTVTKRVAIYARRSRPDKDKDVSIVEQVQACRRWVEEHAYEVTEVYEEPGLSGATGEGRPVFQRMIRDAERGRFDMVLTWDLNRFGRTDNDEAGFWRHTLKRAHVEVVHVMDADRLSGEAGEIVRPVLQAAAHDYLKQTSKNVVRGLVAAVKRGTWTGGPAPYGYRLCRREGWDGQGRRDTKLAVNEPEAAIVKQVYDLYLRGTGYARIAGILNSGNVRPRSGGDWTVSTIRGILANEIYAGRIVRGRPRRARRCEPPKFYRGSERGPIAVGSPCEGYSNENAFTPLISPDVFDRAQALAGERATKRTGGIPAPLSGIARCGVCGGPLGQRCGRSGRTENAKKRWAYYQCVRCRARGLRETWGDCALVSVNADKLDQAVIQLVRQEAADFNAEELESDVRVAYSEAPVADVAALETRRKRLAGRRDELLLADDLDRLGLAKLADEDQRLAREIGEANAAAKKKVDVDAAIEQAVEAIQQLEAPKTPAGRTALRSALRAFVQRIQVDPAPRGAVKPVRVEVRTARAVVLTTLRGGRGRRSPSWRRSRCRRGRPRRGSRGRREPGGVGPARPFPGGRRSRA